MGTQTITTIAAVTRRLDGDFAWEDVVVDPPGPGELGVRLSAVGICHTDLAAATGRLPVVAPVVLGHEGCGVVESVGTGVTGFAVGDRVVMSFMSCGDCPACRAGRSYHCARFRELNFGARRTDGTTPFTDAAGEPVGGQFFGQSAFSRHTVVSARRVVRLPDDVPDAVAAPLGCAVMTGVGAVLGPLGVGPGAAVVIAGTGSVGLSAVAAARVAGATTVVAVDVSPSRLALARELGATHVADVSVEPLSHVIASLLGRAGPWFDQGLDTTGRQQTVNEVAASVVPGGTAGFLSFSGGASTFDFDVVRGRTLTGIVAGGAEPAVMIPLMIDLWRDGRLPVERLVTTYPFDHLHEAVAAMSDGTVVKPVLLADEPV